LPPECIEPHVDTTRRADGDRVLVDRLWPRGVSKENAKLDEWDRELGPSAKLREWFCMTQAA
jgi:uncharacterized protein YeaO (DUF488 family)